jgi:hypothetical protein
MDRNNKNSKNSKNSKPANNAKNNKSTSKRQSKPMKMNLDATNILLGVVIILVLYFVFFDKNHKLSLYNHRHKKEAFNNKNGVADDGKTTLVLFHAEWCG